MKEASRQIGLICTLGCIMTKNCKQPFVLHASKLPRQILSTQTLSQGDAFLRKGYQNWKHALEKTRGFQKHEMSQAHKEATIRYVKSSSNQPDVVDMVSSEAEKQRFKNRQMLLKILTNIRFLARQGLPLRGSWNKEYNIEIDSNFH